jgi:hypothetical protein
MTRNGEKSKGKYENIGCFAEITPLYKFLINPLVSDTPASRLCPAIKAVEENVVVMFGLANILFENRTLCDILIWALQNDRCNHGGLEKWRYHMINYGSY